MTTKNYLIFEGDVRLSDSRNPTTHSSSHNIGGTDAIATASASSSGLLSSADWTAFNAKQAEHRKSTITLAVAGWSSTTKKQQVQVTGVTAANTVIVSPDVSTYTEYLSSQIRCISQRSGELEFLCTVIPETAITVNVVILA